MTCQSFARWIDGTGRAVTSAARANTSLRHAVILSRLQTVNSDCLRDRPECRRAANDRSGGTAGRPLVLRGAVESAIRISAARSDRPRYSRSKSPIAYVSPQEKTNFRRSLVCSRSPREPRVTSAIHGGWRSTPGIAAITPCGPPGRVGAIGPQRARSFRRSSTICLVRAGTGSAESRHGAGIGAGIGADARAEREGFAADGIIVLAGGLKRDGSVPEWVARRLDAAAELYRAMHGGEGEAAVNGGQSDASASASASTSASPSPSANTCRCPIVVLGAGTPHVQPVLSQHGHMWHESSACAQYLVDKVASGAGGVWGR
ncbi:unnamed protein product [Closterium sp. Yama58-4]|nr:unnamed protein product [Closterium sp. Yama58-4]